MAVPITFEFVEHAETSSSAPRCHQAEFVILDQNCPWKQSTLGTLIPLVHIHFHLQKYKVYIFTLLQAWFSAANFIHYRVTVQVAPSAEKPILHRQFQDSIFSTLLCYSTN